MTVADRVILEGIVTSLPAADAAEGALSISPMGPLVDERMDTLVLRPFQSSSTFRNLRAHGEGVFHVTDDVGLLARAAIGRVSAPVESTSVVRGYRLRDACRSYEFRVREIDERQERATLVVDVVHVERLRDFFGWHRARHAVLEAAILATRVAILPIDDIRRQLEALAPLVEKTGGQVEREAFRLLCAHIDAAAEGAPR